MGLVVFANNAGSTLASAITAVQTTITIQSAHTALFPSPAAGDWFPVTLVDGADMEIMHCTARTGAVLTVVRGREGTTAKLFNAGVTVDHRLTKSALDTFLQIIPTTFAGAAPPPAPIPGQLWWESDTGNLFIWYDDGDSQQWVLANTIAGPPGPTGPAGPAGGPAGPTGPAGAAGVGVPAGGADGQVLTKTAATDYATAWEDPTGGGGGAATSIGDAPPASPIVGQLWWESDTGNLLIWYDDGNSQQWVPATIAGGASGGGGGGGPVAWVDITGKPATFPPTLPIAQSGVTSLVTDLAAKEPTIAAGTTAQYWRGDKSWQTLPGGGGSGDVIGPASTVDNTVPRFDTTTGKLIQSSTLTLADDGQFALKSGANTVLAYTTSGTSSSGGLVLTAMPPHGQYLSIIPRSDVNGALCLNSGGGFNFDSALSIGSGSSVSNTVSLSRQTSGTTHALKIGSGLLNLTPAAGAPSAPTNGDIWTTSASVFARVNGATVDLAAAGGAADWSTITGKPSTFPPTVPIAQTDITNLTTDLAALLPKAGGTMTGALVLDMAMPAISLIKNATNNAVITGRTSSQPRWAIYPGNATAEAGSNSGADFGIERYSDGGTSLGLPLQISRATGLMTVTADPQVALGVVTKQYVDARITNKITVASTAPSSPAVNDLWVDTS